MATPATTPTEETKPAVAPAPETEETPAETSEEETSESAESDLSEAEGEEARRLYKALRDPAQAGPLVAALAQHAGLHLSAAPTPTELKKETKSIAEVVKQSLGPEFQFLSDRLSSALEGALALHAEQQNARLQELSQTMLASDVERAYEKLARETKGESKRLETRMSELAEEIPIGKQTVETYIRRLYTVASGESASRTSKQTADKIRKNASDASARLPGTAAEPATQVPNKKMSLTESVEFAVSQQLKR